MLAWNIAKVFGVPIKEVLLWGRTNHKRTEPFPAGKGSLLYEWEARGRA